MLLYSNGRMSYGNISFGLPEGFCFDGTIPRGGSENMISFVRNHDAYYIAIDIWIHDTDNSAIEFTSNWFHKDWEYHFIKKVFPTRIDGLSGYHALYRSTIKGRETESYAAFLENSLTGEEHLVLELVIECNGISIETVMKIPEIQAMITSIKGE